MTAATRLTRAERKEQTRCTLLRSGVRVFGRRGLGASLDDVAEDAGFTKGALYAHFASKDELFLAILDEHMEARVRNLAEVLAHDEPAADQAREAGADYMRALAEDPEWPRLFLEFATYAQHNRAFGRALAEHLVTTRERMAAMLGASGFPDVKGGVAREQVIQMCIAMADGVALQRSIMPAEVPDDLYPAMLHLLFSGLEAQVLPPRAA